MRFNGKALTAGAHDYEDGLHRVDRFFQFRDIYKVLDVQPDLQPWHYRLQAAAQHARLVLRRSPHMADEQVMRLAGLQR